MNETETMPRISSLCFEIGSDCLQKSNEDDETNSVSVLSLAHFCATPFVSFGRVKLNTFAEKILKIKNPDDYERIIQVDKVPTKKGFSVNHHEIEIGPLEEIEFKIFWLPTTEANYRETLSFRVDGIINKNVILLGSAFDSKRKKIRRMKPLREMQTWKKKMKSKDLLTTDKTYMISSGSATKRSKFSGEMPTKIDSKEFVLPVTSLPEHFEIENELDKENKIGFSFYLHEQQDFGKPEILRANGNNSPETASEDLEPLNLKLTPERRHRVTRSRHLGTHSQKSLDGSEFPSRIPVLSTIPSSPNRRLTYAKRQLDADDSLQQTFGTSKKNEKTNSEFIFPACPDTPERRQTYTKIHSKQSPILNLPVVEMEKTKDETVNKKLLQIPAKRRLDSNYISKTKHASKIPTFSAYPVKQGNRICSSVGSSELPSSSIRKHPEDEPCDKSEQCCQTPKALGNLKSSEDKHFDKAECILSGDSLNNESGLEWLDNSNLNHGEITCDEHTIDSEEFDQEEGYPTYSKFCEKLINSFMEEIGEEMGKLRKTEENEPSNPLTSTVTKLSPKQCSLDKRSHIPKPLSRPPSRNTEVLETNQGTSELSNIQMVTFIKPQPSSSDELAPNTPSNVSSTLPQISNLDENNLGFEKEKKQNQEQMQKRKALNETNKRRFRPNRKLTLIRTMNASPVLIKHPNPYAAKNTYYDERWMEKQTQGFTNWLNFVLALPQEFDFGGYIALSPFVLDGNVDAKGRLVPSRESLSLREYTIERKMNKLRCRACRLYHSEYMIHIISRLEDEIENARLSIRKDKAVHVDVGIREKLQRLIMNYHPLWLRIGLETVFGHVIMLRSNTDIEGLSNFIFKNVLNNPDIARDYSHPTVPHLYKPGYAAAIKKHVLKKFLLLVLFLDHAKLARIIDFDPCLFRIEAPYKSSRDILLLFAREYLAGEGDITKHLGYLDYEVSYQQMPLQEFDFSVKNLAVDLRNGVRLARVVELLTGDTTLLNKMRTPATNRFHNTQNVNLVMNALEKSGHAINNVTAKDIVNGHREKTLSFLWQLVLNFQVKIVVQKEKLQKEIDYLQKRLKERKLDDFLYDYVDDKVVDDFDEELQMLLKWCQLVCAHYQVKVHNYTVSFSDGRALCCIINYYYPHLLPFDSIKMETTQTYCNKDVINVSSGSEDVSTVFFSCINEEVNSKMLNNEQHNLNLVLEKVIALGGIPLMIRNENTSNTIPDEKIIITFVSYLCTRILELSTETRSATIIQRAWRQYLFRIKEEKIKTKAAYIIQRLFKHFILQRRLSRRNKTLCQEKQRNAAIVLQKNVRGFLTRKHLRIKHSEESQAAVIIQKNFRRFLMKKKVKCLQETIRNVQSYCRGYLVRVCVQKLLIEKRVKTASALTIQKNVRRFLKQKHYKRIRLIISRLQPYCQGFLMRKEFSKKLQEKRLEIATVKIQAAFRSYRARKDYCRVISSIIIIQRFTRGYLLMKEEQERYWKMKNAAIIIQAWYRKCATQKKFNVLKATTVGLQSYARRKLVQKWADQKKKAVVILQRHAKCYLLRKEQERFHLQTKAATILQAFFKGRVYRQNFVLLRYATIIIQTEWKRYYYQKKFNDMRNATVKIQEWFRASKLAHKQHQRFLKLKMSTIMIQAYCRGYNCRQRIKQRNLAATIIQANFKMNQTRNAFIAKKSAAIVLQQFWRRCLLSKQIRQKYIQKRTACIKIQTFVRCHQMRIGFLLTKKACICIQSSVRRYLARKKFLQMKFAVICIQRCFRSWILSRQTYVNYHLMRGAAITIQRAFRNYLMKNLKIKKGKSSVKVTRYELSPAKLKDTDRFYISSSDEISSYTSCDSRLSRLRLSEDDLNYHIRRGAAITIQAQVRGWLVRKKYMKLIKFPCENKHYFKFKTCTFSKNETFCSSSCNKYFVKVRKCDGVEEQIMSEKLYLPFKVKHEDKFCSNDVELKLMQVERSNKQIRFLDIDSLIKHGTGNLIHVDKIDKEQLRKIAAAVVIQKWIRGWLCRKYYESIKNSALEIQHDDQKLKCQGHDTIILLQSCYRRNETRRNFLSLKFSALTIQLFWRIQREGIKPPQGRIVLDSVLKTFYSMLQARKNYLRFKDSTFLIKSTFEGFEAKRRYFVLLYKVNHMCTTYRKQQAAVKIFNWFKKQKERQAEEKAKMQTLHKFISSCKLHLSAICIQRAYKRYKEEKCATKIQALWRGYKVRKGIADRRISEVREKIELSAKNANPNETLWMRTLRALDKLLCYRYISTVIQALENLDIATQHSFVCCEKIAQSEGLDILCQIISRCNRSPPHIEILIHIVSIFLQIAKHHQLRSYVWKLKNVTSYILRIIRNYHDTRLMFLCCNLLKCFSSDDEYKLCMHDDKKITEEFQITLHKIKPKVMLNQDKKSSNLLENRTRREQLAQPSNDRHISFALMNILKILNISPKQ